MMDYQDFDTVELASDEYFQKWVIAPSSEINTFWEQFLLENPSKQREVEEARELILSLHFQDVQEVTKQRLEKVKNHVLTEVRNEKEAPEKPLFNWLTVSIAASVILAIVSYFTLFTGSSNYEIQSVDNVISYTEKSTLLGQKSTLKLADGSSVKLNAESKLLIPNNFGVSERVVILEGEAFFSVAKDTLKPFKIISGAVTTQVLGTSFNVNAYNLKNISIAVVTGKVAVKNKEGQKTTNLLPGELVSVTDGAILEKESFDQEKLIGWKDGIIVFEESNLTEITEKLERWFGVSIKIEAAVNKERTYTGKFDNENLENILLSIGEIAKFKFKIEDKNVILSK